jgi:hypothetical protein
LKRGLLFHVFFLGGLITVDVPKQASNISKPSHRSRSMSGRDYERAEGELTFAQDEMTAEAAHDASLRVLCVCVIFLE